MILKEDIYSTFNKGHQYGKKGEQVKLISTNLDVLIVEGKTGRFSVKKEKVIN
jgi:hypothetical protein